MNTYSVSRLALALAFGVTLSACSSTPADQQPSTQTAPGTTARPILNAEEAKNFTPAAYFQSLAPNAAARRLPSACRRSLTLSSALREPGRNPYHHSGGGGCGNCPSL